MFIKTTKLEQVLKKAYKGAGIRIERRGDIITMITAYLYIEADMEKASNDFKALIMKFAGEIPEDGYCKKITDYEVQDCIKETITLNLITKDLSSSRIFKETLFQYMGEQIFQDIVDGRLVIVPAKEWSTYDEKQMDDSEEITDRWKEVGGYIVTKSDEMVLGLQTVTNEDLDEIKTIELP